ncbi:SDR family NAD(P)-dependent oxidoreductase [Singulisphaera sp. Ch08]|uniref:SDR family NAD(P)-dependent oxidoreductase n=1 Tax=Singulisphaera sp. Ch08 TaxID=3120278 RepID=A0AAU7CPV6_9BACT
MKAGQTVGKNEGQVILLTGAAQGIGRATAKALAARGYRLGLMDRYGEPLETLEAELKNQTGIATAQVDVCDALSLKRAVESLEERLGPTEILVACAGVGTSSNALDLDVDGFRRMLEVNVVGVAHSIDAVLPGMFARKAGHIVGISSVAGYRGMPWMPGYSASKAALTTYLEALRPALKRRGVTITTVYPGFVRTGMTLNTSFRNPVPMLEAEQAAAYLVRAIVRRPRDYTFPLGTAIGMDILRRLPCRLFDWVMDRAGPRALTTEF